jgi:hypothetical protein
MILVEVAAEPVWREPAKGAAGPVVHLVGDVCEVLGAVHVEVTALSECSAAAPPSGRWAPLACASAGRRPEGLGTTHRRSCGRRQRQHPGQRPDLSRSSAIPRPLRTGLTLVGVLRRIVFDERDPSSYSPTYPVQRDRPPTHPWTPWLGRHGKPVVTQSVTRVSAEGRNP